jgi:hypothetical protein
MSLRTYPTFAGMYGAGGLGWFIVGCGMVGMFARGWAPSYASFIRPVDRCV